MIAGEGYERPALEALIAAPRRRVVDQPAGYVDDERLVDLYRAAWVVASLAARRDGA